MRNRVTGSPCCGTERPLPIPTTPGAADRLGSRIVRNLSPGTGYAWRDDASGQKTHTFTVLAPGSDPSLDSSLYTSQPLHEGLNYITIRDGISLAATVRFPFDESCSTALRARRCSSTRATTWPAPPIRSRR